MPTEAEVQSNARALVDFTERGDRPPVARSSTRPVEALTSVPIKGARALPRPRVSGVLAVVEWAASPLLTVGLIVLLHAVGLA